MMNIPFDIPRLRSFFGADTPPLKSTVMQRLPLERSAGTYPGGAFVPAPRTSPAAANAEKAINEAKAKSIFKAFQSPYCQTSCQSHGA